MHELLDRFTLMSLPDAIDSILLQMDDSGSGNAFERYASRMLAEIGASRLREVAVTKNIDVVRLTATDMFWLRGVSNMNEEEHAYLLATEGVMNRLHLIEDDMLARQSAVDGRWEASLTEDKVYEADIRVIEGIAKNVTRLIKQRSHNHMLEMHGVRGEPGGEWDVRTRFAVAIEALKLPYRLDYLFDCDVERGLFRVKYSVPQASWMPRSHFDQNIGQWVDRPDAQKQMAWLYALRLGAVVAASAFGTSVAIQRVHVSAHEGKLSAGNEVLSMCIDRMPFIVENLPGIARNDALWPNDLYNCFKGKADELDSMLLERHQPLDQDMRELPHPLREMLHADRAWELDVLTDMPDNKLEVVKEAEADIDDSPMAALATLEQIVSEAPGAHVDEQGRYPLYCADVFARAIVGQSAVSKKVRYFRYPDDAFSARSVLCDLCLRMGEPNRALGYALELIELAPTSTIGYTDAANALFEQGRHADSIPYLETALRLATHELAVAWVFYRLAYALWQSGKMDEGLACYVLCSYHGFPRPSIVSSEMTELMQVMDTQEVPSVPEAIETIQRIGIKMPWGPQEMKTVAAAIIGLCDAGILVPAGLLCATNGLSTHRDELTAVSLSMRAWEPDVKNHESSDDESANGSSISNGEPSQTGVSDED